MNGVPALMNLSWDGGDTGFAARSACPITLQVMNTNCGSKHAVGLLAYLPKIEVSQAGQSGDNFKQAAFFVLQTCIGKIVSLIEKYAPHGFKGLWDNILNTYLLLQNHIYHLKHTFAI